LRPRTDPVHGFSKFSYLFTYFSIYLSIYWILLGDLCPQAASPSSIIVWDGVHHFFPLLIVDSVNDPEIVMQPNKLLGSILRESVSPAIMYEAEHFPCTLCSSHATHLHNQTQATSDPHEHKVTAM
jgi:hypothetical protein